jgi:prepilin-type N-terminal cleavage/methylation domain-containing protein
MRSNPLTQNTKAVTLTELLVVLAIIGLLSTIAIPVYVNRVEQAKYRVAQQEVAEIAQAQEICGASHGFYVPLQMLDDLPDDVNVSSTARDDDLQQENDLYIIDLAVPIDEQLTAQKRLSDRTTDPKVANLYDYWLGPFLNPQRVYIGDAVTNDPQQIQTTIIHLDYPLDPWGTPYRFYSSLGIIGTNASADTNVTPGSLGNLSFGDGALTTSDDRFDRFAIVSYGPDRVSDSTTTTSPDDLIYHFGMLFTESTYRGLTLIP